MKIIVITTDDKVIEKTIKNNLSSLQKEVGGNIQLFPHKQGYEYDIMCYVNEEGINKKLVENILAKEILSRLNFSIWEDFPVCGNIIFVNNNEGKSLTKEMITRIKE